MTTNTDTQAHWWDTPAAMTERLIDAAIYNEQASGGYVAGARRELNEARAAIEAALAASPAAPAPAAGVDGFGIPFEQFWGEISDQERERIRKTDLYKRGDTVVVWVNEGDLYMARAAFPTPNQNSGSEG